METKELCERAKALYAERNYIEAVKLWRAAAEQNDAEALYMLGICHNYNLGVDEADETARGASASGYFLQAAALGHADAQCFAGLCYLHRTKQRQSRRMVRKSGGAEQHAGNEQSGLVVSGRQ